MSADKKETRPSPVSTPTSSEEQDEKYYSKTLGKALEILELVRRSPRPVSLKEVSDRVGLPKSSVFRALYTLEAAGYVTKSGEGSYTLKAELNWSATRQVAADLVRVATPLMVNLRRRFNETVSLGVLFENHIEVVSVVESPEIVRMGNIVGRILPPHASSLGKAIAAFLDEERLERLLRSYGLQRFSPRTITDELSLKKELERVREQGWGTDDGESTGDGMCFGAPIFVGGCVVAAMSVSIPRTRVPGESGRRELVKEIRETCLEVARQVESRGDAV